MDSGLLLTEFYRSSSKEIERTARNWKLQWKSVLKVSAGVNFKDESSVSSPLLGGG